VLLGKMNLYQVYGRWTQEPAINLRREKMKQIINEYELRGQTIRKVSMVNLDDWLVIEFEDDSYAVFIGGDEESVYLTDDLDFEQRLTLGYATEEEIKENTRRREIEKLKQEKAIRKQEIEELKRLRALHPDIEL
jgi:hypothetical protein